MGIYHDIEENALLSVEEYARSTNESEADVRRRLDIANLMVEFLDFINAPKQFYIARDLQIYYPLEELLKLIRKCREDEAEDLKIAVFNNILMQTSSDMTRFIRGIKAVVGSDYLEGFLEEQKELAAQTVDTLPPVGKMDTTTIRDVVRANEEVTRALEGSMEKALTKVRKNETRNRPVQLAEKATTFLESIDCHILTKLNDSELRRLDRQLGKLEQVIAQLRENM